MRSEEREFLVPGVSISSGVDDGHLPPSFASDRGPTVIWENYPWPMARPRYAAIALLSLRHNVASQYPPRPSAWATVSHRAKPQRGGPVLMAPPLVVWFLVAGVAPLGLKSG